MLHLRNLRKWGQHYYIVLFSPLSPFQWPPKYMTLNDHGWFSSSVRLSFRFTGTLDYLKICKFITYWSLEAVNTKKSITITGTTNWNRTKFGADFLRSFSAGFTRKTQCVFLGITQASEPWTSMTRTLLFCGDASLNFSNAADRTASSDSENQIGDECG